MRVNLYPFGILQEENRQQWQVNMLNVLVQLFENQIDTIAIFYVQSYEASLACIHA